MKLETGKGLSTGIRYISAPLRGRLLQWRFDTVTLAHRCRRGPSGPLSSAPLQRYPVLPAVRGKFSSPRGLGKIWQGPGKIWQQWAGLVVITDVAASLNGWSLWPR